MALIVGTNTYRDLSEVNAYFEDRIHASTWFTKEDVEKEQAILIALNQLDLSYEFKGTPTVATQLLSWPRDGVLTRNGDEISNIVVPTLVKDAQCELAFQWVIADQMMPDGASFTKDDANFTKGGIAKEKLGPMEREYFGRGYVHAVAAGYAPIEKTYPYVDLLLSDFVTASSSSQFKRMII